MKTLPDKPSELITLALNDLLKVEKDKRYKIDMDTWHTPNGKCAICLAGAVMAKSLGADIHMSSTPAYAGSNTNKLCALEWFRLGVVDTGISILEGYSYYDKIDSRHIPKYSPKNRLRFFRAMRKLARDFKKVGD